MDEEKDLPEMNVIVIDEDGVSYQDALDVAEIHDFFAGMFGEE
jgi:predicted double-glycine peptidase